MTVASLTVALAPVGLSIWARQAVSLCSMFCVARAPPLPLTSHTVPFLSRRRAPMSVRFALCGLSICPRQAVSLRSKFLRRSGLRSPSSVSSESGPARGADCPRVRPSCCQLSHASAGRPNAESPGTPFVTPVSRPPPCSKRVLSARGTCRVSCGLSPSLSLPLSRTVQCLATTVLRQPGARGSIRGCPA